MSQRAGGGTHVALAGAVGADVAAHVEVADEPVALQGVDPRGEGQHGPLLRGGELHLGQVVDEEIELGGYAAQTGFDQPGGGEQIINTERGDFMLGHLNQPYGQSLVLLRCVLSSDSGQ